MRRDYITRLKLIFALLMLVSILPTVALAVPTEASGTVTNVVDGDTFDIRVEVTDPRIIYEIERVRLADVDSPEMSTSEGPLAKVFTTAILLDKKVWLDIDDRSEDGRGPYDRLICAVYLAGSDGQLITYPCFNRMLVDYGYAEVKDFTTNEFNPDNWWTSGGPASVDAPVVKSTGNQLPLISSFKTSKTSPQNAGTSVIFSVGATDPEGDRIYYQFWQKGPNTGNAWNVARDWGIAGTWIKSMSSSDIGDNQFRVWIRDDQDGHADENHFDDEEVITFKVNAPSSSSVTGSSSSTTTSRPSVTSSASSSNGPFVGSKNSDVYHYPWCASAKRIKSSNKVTFSSSADARAHGYRPCQKCHPP